MNSSLLLLDLSSDNSLNNNVESNRDEIVNYKDNIPNSAIGDYYSSNFNGTGKDINITLHQSILNTTDIEFSNLDNSNTFKEACPTFKGFNSSFINISVDGISAQNKTILVEDDTVGIGTWIFILYWTSFQVRGDCYLENFSIMVNTDDAAIFNIDLWNSYNYSGIPKYSSDLNGGGTTWKSISIGSSTSSHWENFTRVHERLNCSDTYNNTFFISVVSSAMHGWWDNGDHSDAEGDETIVYRGSTSDPIDLDMTLKFDVAPLKNTPKPSEIGLKINKSIVSNDPSGENKGYWENYTAYQDSSGELEFEVTADWWDVSCNISSVLINYTKTDLLATSEFDILGSGQDVLWNVTRSGGLNYFDSRLNNYTINFTIPSTWNDVEVWNGGTNKTGDIVLDPLGNGYTEVQVLNAGNGDFWFLNANSDNLLSSIGTAPISRANYSDTVLFNASFITTINNAFGNDQGINLSIYNPEAINSKLNYTNIIDTYNSDEIDLGDWDIATNITQYGDFRIQVFWFNDTAVGFREEILTVFGETDIQTTISKSVFDITETFNITVQFEDTGQTQRIDNADINYTINGGLNWRYDNITPLGNGEYNITIDCTEFGGYGLNTIQVNASKQYYNNQTYTFDITILAPTILKVDPLSRTDFASSEIFNITIQYNDTYVNNGIDNAIINYTLDGSNWRDENITPLGNGEYNITIDCSDNDFDEYGTFTITINASMPDYHNQSEDAEDITITGVNLLTIDYPSDYDMFYSSELFNITVYFEDTSRTQGIDGANIEVDVIGEGEYIPLAIDPLPNGRYNITINCSDSIFGNYRLFTIRVNASKKNYENSTNTVDIIVIGDTSLTVLYPPTGAYYRPTGLFNITIFYNDTVKNQGITGADLIEYSIDGNTFRSDNVFPIGIPGQYNITIDTEDPEFVGYGPKVIPIRINKTYYHNTSTTYSFNLEINTTISPGIGPINLGKIFRGDNVSYTFNYSDTTGKPIEGAGWDIVYNDAIFLESPNLIDQGNGNYTIWLNSTGVTAREPYYTFRFNISATGNETQEITLYVTILLPRTEVVDYTEVTNVEFGLNLTLSFILKNNYTGSFINDLGTENVLVTNLAGALWNISYGVDPNFDNGGWELIPNFDGNYSLIISTDGLENGGVYTVIINITYYSLNPGPYNYSIISFQFTYGAVSLPPSDGGGGGGGGGGTKVTGIPFETLVLYIIIIAALVGTVAAIVGIQKGVIAPKKREKERILREVTTIFDDAINLEHILVIYKTSGTCVFFKSYGMEEIDPELISGFLSAVSSFGREMDSQEALNEIQYGDKMLLLADGEFIRVALVLDKQASIILRQHLKEFIDIYEEKYAKSLPDWRGQLADFRDSGELIDQVFSTSIILPHQVKIDTTKVKALKSPHSKDVLKIASSLVAEDSDKKYFFIATLLVEATDKTGKEKAEVFMGIKELRDTNILTPIEIAAIEKPQITQQELELIKQQVSDLPGLAEEEIDDITNNLAQMGPAEREAYLASSREQTTVVSAPIKTKAETGLIDSVKIAKKEIKNLKKLANTALKRKDTQRAIEIYNNAAVLATNWDLTKEFEEIEDVIRITTINDLKGKLRVFESEAKVAAKAGDYNEATEKYSLASRAASEIFKLGITEMTKEVKRLTNKSKEYERLS